GLDGKKVTNTTSDCGKDVVIFIACTGTTGLQVDCLNGKGDEHPPPRSSGSMSLSSFRACTQTRPERQSSASTEKR
ncbi:hypothetical protein TNCV_250891, partial [Trichonephila clavipes]